MDLGLTRRGDYVVRAALHLARTYDTGEWQKAADVAQQASIPVAYAHQILRLLVDSHIAEARAGNTGGYRLCHNPREINLRAVVETGEGELKSSRCVLRGSGCNPKRPCALHPVIARSHELLRAELDRTTLDQLILQAT